MNEIIERARKLAAISNDGILRGTTMDVCNIAEMQAREIERLQELIHKTGDHWLELQHVVTIPWEGAIDKAMEAACNEIKRFHK